MTGQIIDFRSYRCFEQGQLYRTESDRLPDLDRLSRKPRLLPSPVVWWGVFAFLAAFWGCAIGAGLLALGAF